MSKVAKAVRVDPAAAEQKFRDDLAKMAAGQQSAAPQKQIMVKNFAALGFRYRIWDADLTASDTLADALRPSFWASVTDKIVGGEDTAPKDMKGVGDIIVVRQPSTGLLAVVSVVEVGLRFLGVRLEWANLPPEIELPEDCIATLRWNEPRPGQRGSWDVLSKANKRVLQAGFQTKAAAADFAVSLNPERVT